MDSFFLVEFVDAPIPTVGKLDTVLTIGRDEGQLQFDHEQISNPHCTLINNDGIVGILDQGSEHGTFINGKKIAPKKLILLMENDQVSLGQIPITITPKKGEREEAKEPAGLELENPTTQQKESSDSQDPTSVLELETIAASDESSEAEATGGEIELERPAPQSKEDATQVLTSVDLQKEKLKEQQRQEQTQTQTTSQQNSAQGNFAQGSFAKLKGSIGSPQGGLDEDYERTGIKKHKLRRVYHAGGLIRSLALFNDIVLTFIAASLLRSFDLWTIVEPIEIVFHLLADVALGFVVTDGQPNNTSLWIQASLSLFAVFWFLRFLGAVIFGLSFGQVLVGMNSQASAMQSRISAFMRVLFDIVTKPTVITELPALLGLRTGKEVLSKSELGVYSPVLSYIAGVISAGGITAYFLVLPIMEIPSLRKVQLNDIARHFPQQVTLSETKGDNTVVKADSEESNSEEDDSEQGNAEKTSPQQDDRVVSTHRSKSVHFSFQKDIAPSREFLTFPSFELAKGEKKNYLPVLNIFHVPTLTVATWQKSKVFELDKALAPLLESYPFSKARFPHLYSYMKGEVVIDGDLHQDMSELFKAVYSLDMENLVDHLFQFGPFFQAFIDLRHRLDSYIPQENWEEVALMTSDKSFFLQFRAKAFGKHEHYFARFDHKGSEIFMLTYPDDKKSFEKAFLDNYFAGVKWGVPRSSIDDYDAKKSIDTYGILDFFAEKKLDEQRKKQLQSSFFRSYARMAQVSLKMKYQPLKDHIIKKIEKMDGFLKELLDKETYENFDKRFKNITKKLSAHLKAADQSVQDAEDDADKNKPAHASEKSEAQKQDN